MSYFPKKSITYPKKLFITLCIWGEPFWNNFLEFFLTSRLSPNNLPLLSKHFECAFRIYTYKEEISQYLHHPKIQRLKRVLPVEFIPIAQDLVLKKKYELASRVQSQAVKHAFEDKGALFFDAPDVFFGPNVYKKTIEHILNGQQLIIHPNFSLNLDDFIHHPLVRDHLSHETFINLFELNEIAFKTLHKQLVQNLFINSNLAQPIWNHRFWRIDSKCMAQKGFHLHPFYLWPQNCPTSLPITVDEGEYLFHCIPNRRKHMICCDPQSTYYELSPPSPESHKPSASKSILDCFYWARLSVHPKQYSWIYKTKYTTSEDINRPPKKPLSIKKFEFSLFLLQHLPFCLVKLFLWKAHKRFRQTSISFFKFYFEVTLWNYFEDLLLRSASKMSTKELFEFALRNKKKLCNEALLKTFSDRLVTLSIQDYRPFFLSILKLYPNGILAGKILRKLSTTGTDQQIKEVLCTEILKQVPYRFIKSCSRRLVRQDHVESLQQLLKLKIDKKRPQKTKSL